MDTIDLLATSSVQTMKENATRTYTSTLCLAEIDLMSQKDVLDSTDNQKRHPVPFSIYASLHLF